MSNLSIECCTRGKGILLLVSNINCTKFSASPLSCSLTQSLLYSYCSRAHMPRAPFVISVTKASLLVPVLSMEIAMHLMLTAAFVSTSPQMSSAAQAGK